MKVLLTTLNSKYIHLNLAIRLLYALNKHRGNLDWQEFTIKEKAEDIAARCMGYEVIAFSCYIWNITQTLAVARKIKALHPEVKILLGGPEVSYEYDDFIALPEVDFIIVGEGEIPFGLFLDHYPDVSKVPNLVYKAEEKVHFFPAQLNFDLENYAGVNPYIHDKPEELFNKVCYIETSRGCPYKCEFCLASLDNKVRFLPIEDIKSNLLYLMEHGRVIKFLDRTFNVKKDFTIDIFQFILKHHRPGNIFQFEITADIVHPEIVAFILEHIPKGLFRFEIGIQTVNQKANLQVSRKQNFEKTSGVIKQLDHIVEMHLDLIVGLPLDEWEDVRFSIEETFKLHPPELQLGFLKFLRGTPMRHKHEQHDYVFDVNPPYQIIESKYLSKEQLFDLTLLEEALEIYWNKKRALHTLKYISKHYSIFDFLLGLGSYFNRHSDFHKHSLYDIYDMLSDFAARHYEKDELLKQLIAIDYYSQSKIKPQIRYQQEIYAADKQTLIDRQKLNHHKFRFIVLQVTFDMKEYLQSGKIIKGLYTIVFQYDGMELPEMTCLSEVSVTT
jgi:anaerobic magnesium-protoporphyrin IX monomethyl ester cyclase